MNDIDIDRILEAMSKPGQMIRLFGNRIVYIGPIEDAPPKDVERDRASSRINWLQCNACGFKLEPGAAAQPKCPDCGGPLNIHSDSSERRPWWGRCGEKPY